MTKNEIKAQDEGLELAKRMAEEEEGVGRRPEGAVNPEPVNGFNKFLFPD